MIAGLAVEVYQTQAEFITDAHRFTAFVGGRNSGKTYAGSLKAIAAAGRGGLGCIAAPNFPMLEYGAKRQFITRLDEAGEAYSLTRSGVVIPRFRAEVIFVTLESESRVRGPNYAWGWADEVEYVADRAIWRAFKGAIRDGDHPQLFVTTTPKGRRLVWDEWVVGKTTQHALHKATTYDNPFIDAADYVTGLGYEGAFYDQEITADFVSFEGLVYPGFDRERHVMPVDCGGWGTILALDLGANNPTALLTIRHAGDRVHIEREAYRPMDADEIKACVLAEYAATKADFLVADPSGKIVLDTLVGSVRLRKGKNEIVPGVSRVAAALPNMTVDPSCVNTIAEFESYQYPDRTQSRDVPAKANDHSMDALRYAIMELTGGRTAPSVAPQGTIQRSDWR